VSNSKIFCNTPWYELHVYWDGGLGVCCQESHRVADPAQYNIANTTIQQWFNSQPVQDFRAAVLGNVPYSACSSCYKEECHGGHSRRIRSNLKSAIFSQAFDASFAQSPGRRHFKLDTTQTQPIDIHVDLGNYCNLACKMCNAQASSRIAHQEVKWGKLDSSRYLLDWTRDESVWQSFKQQLLDIPKLNNIHFMGGETLLTDRFEDLVDTLIEHQRFETCFSFVTNGTVFRPELMAKLTKFRRVGIEVSIETVDEHNAYQRQGTDTAQVLHNIDRYLEVCNGTNITVSLRPAVGALTIGYFGGLLMYALQHKLIVKSLQVNTPRFLDAAILPIEIRQQYAAQYQDILNHLDSIDVVNDYNASDPNNYQLGVKQQAQMCINMLSQPEPQDVDQLLVQFVDHCKKWDKIYNYNARLLYPELAEIWDRHGY